MMAVVGDNADEPTDQPTPPRGLDADEYRRFLEFQRFQDYQRFVETQQGTGNNLPVPMPAAQPSAPPQPPHPELAAHLAGMRQQLARIEKVTNPPTWQKILRNKWLHRALWLVIIVALASWGVPKVIQHYLGGGDQQTTTGPANLPAPIGQSGALPTGPHDAVQEVYLFVGDNNPSYQRFLCSDLFTPTAARQFGAAHADGGTCVQAMDRLHAQVKPGAGDTYGMPDLTQLPAPQGTSMVISSCDFTVTDGPMLGTFTVVQQDKGWQIVNYAPPTACPSSAPPS
jgi:hypothetical protein